MILLKPSAGRPVLVMVRDMKDILLRPRNNRVTFGGEDIEGLELECFSSESLKVVMRRLREKGYKVKLRDGGTISKHPGALKIKNPTVPLCGPYIRILSRVNPEDLRKDVGHEFKILWFTKNSQAIIR